MDIQDTGAVLLHVHAVIHVCKQMELDMNLSKAQEAVTNAECDLKIAKETYAQVHSSEKKKAKGSKGEAKGRFRTTSRCQSRS